MFNNNNDPSHESHNALDIYPTMHHFVTEMCTFLLQNCALWPIVGYGTGALWNVCNRVQQVFSQTTMMPVLLDSVFGKNISQNSLEYCYRYV